MATGNIFVIVSGFIQYISIKRIDMTIKLQLMSY